MPEIIQDPFAIKLSEPICELMEQVQEGRDELNKLRPFSEKVEKRVLKELLPVRVVDSLNTEGIMVTRRQTLDVMHALHTHEAIEKGQTEIKNMLEADEFVIDAADEGLSLTPLFIRELGGIVVDGLVSEAKDFRTTPVIISGAEFQPPEPMDVLPLIGELCEIYRRTESFSGLLRAAWLHATFTRIHPFSDGNGRTGRLLQNWCLINNGYFPVGMPVSRRDDYYDALESADNGEWDDIVEIVCLLELDVISKIRAIIKDEESHSEFVKALSERVSSSRTNSLYKMYYSWRTIFDGVAKAFANTADELNKASDIIHVKYRGYEISSFDDWKEIREEGWMQRSWLFSLLFFVEGKPFYRMIAFFKRHKHQPCDYLDFSNCVSLYFTGVERQDDGTEEKLDCTRFEDDCISLREIVANEGKYYVYTQTPGDDGGMTIEEYDSLNPVVESLFNDVFIKKAGL